MVGKACGTDGVLPGMSDEELLAMSDEDEEDHDLDEEDNDSEEDNDPILAVSDITNPGALAWANAKSGPKVFLKPHTATNKTGKTRILGPGKRRATK